MGANAQTAVPAFTAGQILTAAQQTEINTGIPVFATTVTRDAAFGGAGEKTLAEGQFAYIEATNATQYYDGAAWQPVGASGLTLISTTTIGTTVSSVTVSNAFSSTYDSYKILVSGGSSSAFSVLMLKFGSTVTGYYAGYLATTYSTAAQVGLSDNNAAQFTYPGGCNANGLTMTCDVINPNLAKNTTIFGGYGALDTASSSRLYAGFLNDTTQYTAFTISPNSGTLTGGTIKVYGYANS